MTAPSTGKARRFLLSLMQAPPCILTPGPQTMNSPHECLLLTCVPCDSQTYSCALQQYLAHYLLTISSG